MPRERGTAFAAFKAVRNAQSEGGNNAKLAAMEVAKQRTDVGLEAKAPSVRPPPVSREQDRPFAAAWWGPDARPMFPNGQSQGPPQPAWMPPQPGPVPQQQSAPSSPPAAQKAAAKAATVAPKKAPPARPAVPQRALGETRLIAAVRQGHLEQAEQLLSKKADANAKDRFGETALMEAASIGSADFCSLLLRYGADPGLKSEAGLAALDIAEDETVRGLLRFWREDKLRHAAGRHEEAAVEKLLQGWELGGLELVARASEEGDTVLHACAARPPESGAAARIAKSLIEAKASVNATNLLGETPLILATRASADSASGRQRLELVRLLVAQGAGLNTSDAVLHETPLMEAAGIGDAELVLLLLEAKADHQRASASGRSALDFAASPQIAAILRDPQRAVEEKDRMPQPPPGRFFGGKAPASAAAPPPPKQAAPAPKPAPAQQQRPPEPPKPPPPQPKPAFRRREYSPEAPSKTPAERGNLPPLIVEMLEEFQGFEAAGLEVPPEAIIQDWTREELQLYFGSMGQLWPHSRKRIPGAASARAAAGAKAYDEREGKRGFSPPRPAQAKKRSGLARPPLSMLRPHLRALELPEEREPDQKQLKKAYRLQALKWHPDKNAGDPNAASKAAKFQEALAAYEFLQKALDL